MLGTALQEFAESVAEQTGLRVELDARDLSLPGVLIALETLETPTLDLGALRVGVSVWLVAGAYGTAAALDDLGGMLEKIRPLFADVRDFEPTTINLAGQASDPLPAITFTTTLTITKD